MLNFLQRSIVANAFAYKHDEAAYCLKYLRSMRLNPPSHAQAALVAQMAIEMPTAMSLTIWSHCIHDSDASLFYTQLRTHGLRFGPLGSTSVLIALARLKCTDETLVESHAALVRKHPQELNAQSVSTVLNALARLHYETQDTLSALLRQGTLVQAQFTSQGISASLSAVAHFGYNSGNEVHKAFLDAMVNQTARQIKSFNGQGVAITLNTFAKLKSVAGDPVVQVLLQRANETVNGMNAQSVAVLFRAMDRIAAQNTVLFRKLAERAMYVVSDFTEQGLAFVIRGAAPYTQPAMSSHRTQLLEIIATHATRISNTLSSMGIVYILSGFAKCGEIFHEGLLLTLCDRALFILESQPPATRFEAEPKQFNGQEIGILLTTLAVFHAKNDVLLNAIFNHAKNWLMGYKSQHCVTFLYGLSNCGPHPAKEGMVELMYRRLHDDDLDSIGGQGISNVLLAYAKLAQPDEVFLAAIVWSVRRQAPMLGMMSISVILTNLVAISYSELKDITEHCVANMAIRVEDADTTSLSRILGIMKTTGATVSATRLDALVVVTVMMCNQMTPFELSHCLSAFQKMLQLKSGSFKALTVAASARLMTVGSALLRPGMLRVCEYYRHVGHCTPEVAAVLVSRLAMFRVRQPADLFEISASVCCLRKAGAKGDALAAIVMTLVKDCAALGGHKDIEAKLRAAFSELKLE